MYHSGGQCLDRGSERGQSSVCGRHCPLSPSANKVCRESRRGSLDLMEEMDKMGLTKASSKDNEKTYQLQRAITTAFFLMWGRHPNGLPEADYSGVVRWPYDKNTRCGHYPYTALLSNVVAKYPTVECSLDDETDFATVKKGNEYESIQILQEFDKPVTAVFVTNCKVFSIKRNHSLGVNFLIERYKVDWAGILKETALPADLVAGFRSNVEVRFLFY
jgi:hypothetical protein